MTGGYFPSDDDIAPGYDVEKLREAYGGVPTDDSEVPTHGDEDDACDGASNETPTHQCTSCGTNLKKIESEPRETFSWCTHDDCQRVTRWRYVKGGGDIR